MNISSSLQKLKSAVWTPKEAEELDKSKFFKNKSSKSDMKSHYASVDVKFDNIFRQLTQLQEQLTELKHWKSSMSENQSLADQTVSVCEKTPPNATVTVKPLIIPAVTLCRSPVTKSCDENRKVIIEEEEYQEGRPVDDEDDNVHAAKTENRLMLCLLYTSPSPRDRTRSRMPSSA